MTGFDIIKNTTAVQHGGIQIDSPAAGALQTRANVLLMTQQVENAVLKPVDAGSWSHALRAALAARIATLNALPVLASHYLRMIGEDKFNAIADPADDGSALNLAHVVAFMDRVAVQTRDMDNSDIQMLRERAVSDADIVRLTELNAFMAYQVRLIAGLKLLSPYGPPEVPA